MISVLKYRCLVLDHDDTVVQTLKTLSYPFFCLELEQFRPGTTMTISKYVTQCHKLGFADMCRECFGFTEEELSLEHRQWMDYIMENIPDIFPGIDRIVHRQKAEGGIICVVSHSDSDNILRDYRVHFDIEPDAVYGWDMEPHQRKPHPWPLQDIMQKFQLHPEEILVVDDMQLACQMADPLGVKVAFAGWDDMGVPELRQEMAQRCAYTFYSTAELEKFLFDGDAK
jgi:phosphoglycolate phosphatase/pyrophosphatase PpaX